MYLIRNKQSGPTQLIVRSFSDRREHPQAFTVLNIPGKKEIYLQDEKIVPEYLKRNEKWNLISYKYIPDKEIQNIEEK